MATATTTRRRLSLTGVSKHYGGLTALAGVDFEVSTGEVVALCGDNGAGKSTMVKIISGITPPSSGAVHIDGEQLQLKGPQDAAAQGIQTVYQDLAVCDNLDTIQNLFLGREFTESALFGKRMRRAEMEAKGNDVLRSMNVKIRNYSAPVGSLSGGQRQSVALCRALLWEPDFILLDEPTAALGVPQRREVLAMIERLKERGHGVILVSHDLGDVMHVADRMVVLRLGRKVADMSRNECTREALVAAITGVHEEV